MREYKKENKLPLLLKKLITFEADEEVIVFRDHKVALHERCILLHTHCLGGEQRRGTECDDALALTYFCIFASSANARTLKTVLHSKNGARTSNRLRTTVSFYWKKKKIVWQFICLGLFTHTSYSICIVDFVLNETSRNNWTSVFLYFIWKRTRYW